MWKESEDDTQIRADRDSRLELASSGGLSHSGACGVVYFRGVSKLPSCGYPARGSDEKQPIPGADIIVVSEHVDYWNYTGWTDPFSSAVYSRRQQEYARRFGLDSVYTPQMVVDGRSQFIGSDERIATEAIIEAAQSPKLSLTIQRERDRLVIRSATPFTKDTTVFLVRARDHSVSKVTRGENRGRELRHVSVASVLVDTGLVRKNRVAEFTVDGRLDGRAGERVIAFAQERRTGHIAAVARL